MNDKPQTISFYRKRLPHWEVTGGRYFVTLHLAGAIPEEGQQRIRQISADLEQAVAQGLDGHRLHRAVFREMEEWLHRAESVKYLCQPQIAEMVLDTIRHRENNNCWTMFNYAVMPNHVHLFFRLGNDRPLPQVAAPGAGQRTAPTDGNRAVWHLDEVITEFKKWTGSQAVKLLGLPRGTRFWQREWFDHWSRSLDEDEGIARYIRQNPVKAGLCKTPNDWPYVK